MLDESLPQPRKTPVNPGRAQQGERMRRIGVLISQPRPIRFHRSGRPSACFGAPMGVLGSPIRAVTALTGNVPHARLRL
jgi:hypothetical protein